MPVSVATFSSSQLARKDASLRLLQRTALKDPAVKGSCAEFGILCHPAGQTSPQNVTEHFKLALKKLYVMEVVSGGFFNRAEFERQTLAFQIPLARNKIGCCATERGTPVMSRGLSGVHMP